MSANLVEVLFLKKKKKKKNKQYKSPSANFPFQSRVQVKPFDGYPQWNQQLGTRAIA